MSEISHDSREARRAIYDYLSMGPEVGLGEANVESYKTWIEACDGVTLSPRATVHTGFMQMECAWSVSSGNYLSRYPERTPLAPAEITSHIQAADDIFATVTTEDPVLYAYVQLARYSLPTFEAVCKGDAVTEEEHDTQRVCYPEVVRLLSDYHKEQKRPQDTPIINGMLGYIVLINSLHETSYEIFPGPLRSTEMGWPMSQWHAAIHDPDDQRLRKVAVAHDVPKDTIPLPTSLFMHGIRKTEHGLALLESLSSWLDPQTKGIRRVDAHSHLVKVANGARVHIERHLSSKPLLDTSVEQDMQTWYRKLPPYRSINDADVGDRFTRAVRELEQKQIAGELSPEDLALLASMYMEFALTSENLTYRAPGELAATLQYAEELMTVARDQLPEGSPERFQAALMIPALELYAQLICGTITDSIIDAYGVRVSEIAEGIYNTYQNLPDKTSDDAKTIARLLQKATVGLLAVTHPQKAYVVLPTPRRQQSNGTKRGFDFTLWRKQHDTYKPGAFRAFLALKEDDIVQEETHVLVNTWYALAISGASLSQERPAEKFATLRAFCTIVRGEQTTNARLKKVKKAQAEIWPLFHAATEEW